MPVVKVWCLPADLTEDRLREIQRAIVVATVSVPDVGVKDEHSMVVLFPKDMMMYGLGTEIIIEIYGCVFEDKQLDTPVRNMLAGLMVSTLKQFFPSAMVECFILPYRSALGFYHSSARQSLNELEASRPKPAPALVE